MINLTGIAQKNEWGGGAGGGKTVKREGIAPRSARGTAFK